ncbi:phosphopantothenoylcysteine decarboxylase [bacterium]|nr:phosphopantothenoylcysteine decarboxylase [bacterium]
MKNIFKNRKILVTAGPTWVPIDKVRVITNVFAGRTGYKIAEAAQKMGAKVTLLMGPGRNTLPPAPWNKMEVIPFKYFDELFGLVKREVSSKKYDVIIHSAAVSDYEPVYRRSTKIRSGKKELLIKCKPTIKIVDQIKRYDPSIFLVKFKLELDTSEKELIKIGYKSMMASNADLMVVNSIDTSREGYKTLIIDPQRKVYKVPSRRKLPEILLGLIDERINLPRRRTLC